MSRAGRENPSFTFFADDALAWEPIAWLSDALLGQCFKLVVYGCKLGGALPSDHPLLGLLDPKVIELCTVREGDRVLVVRPHDLPRLMADRRRWRESRRAGAKAAGHDSNGRFKGRAAHADDPPAQAEGTAHAEGSTAYAAESTGVLRSAFSVPRSPFTDDLPTVGRPFGDRPTEGSPEDPEPEREELLDVARRIATKAGTSLTAAVQRVSSIPPGNGHGPKAGFTDPRDRSIASLPWVRVALARAHAELATLEKIDREYRS